MVINKHESDERCKDVIKISGLIFMTSLHLSSDSCLHDYNSSSSDTCILHVLLLDMKYYLIFMTSLHLSCLFMTIAAAVTLVYYMFCFISIINTLLAFDMKYYAGLVARIPASHTLINLLLH